MDNTSNDVVNTKPSQFQIFKGSSAMRMQLDKPTRSDQVFKVGCIYLQAAPANPGPKGQMNGYDWENKKISVKIGVNDISKLLDGLRRGAEVSLFHKFNDDSKSIVFSPNEQRGGFWLNLEHKTANGNTSKVSVPLATEEVTAFLTMLQFSLPLIHNWV